MQTVPPLPADRVLAAVDAAWSETEARLDALLAIPSVDGTEAEPAAQRHLAAAWATEGFEVDEWVTDLDELGADPRFPGMETPRRQVVGVVATWRGSGGGPSLLINGHTDVVPPGDPASWTGDPFVPRRATIDGREHVVARGACDMKAGLVAGWAAVSAVRDAGVLLRGDVVLAPVSAEEDGGAGTFALLHHGVRADACVVPEPTDLDLVPANGGALTFRLTVPGMAIHAARRTEGVSALEKFLPVVAALQDLETRRNADVDPLMARWPIAYPLSIGTVRAGDWASTVPGLLIAEGRLGVALGESVAQARAALETTVAAVCAADGFLAANPVRVEWWGGQYASGATDPAHPLLDALRRAHRAAGGADLQCGPAGTRSGDLRRPLRLGPRQLVGIGGIPTVQYGPGDTLVAHAADEHVALDEVRACARALALLLLDHCAWPDRHRLPGRAWGARPPSPAGHRDGGLPTRGAEVAEPDRTSRRSRYAAPVAPTLAPSRRPGARQRGRRGAGGRATGPQRWC